MSGAIHVVTPGATAVPFVALKDGERLGPFSIGCLEGWIVRGHGVLPAHANVYFDGSRLHMSSVDPALPVLVDGRPLPAAWTAIDRACQILIGDVELRVASSVTGSLDAVGTEPRRREASRWPFALAGAIIASSVVTTIRVQHAARVVDPVTVEVPRAQGGAAATGARSAQGDVGAAGAAGGLGAAGAATAATAATGAPGRAAPSVVGGVADRAGSALAGAVVVHPVSHPPSSERGATAERRAADAVHAGDWRRAAELYRELAARYPDNVAFVAAARILGVGAP